MGGDLKQAFIGAFSAGVFHGIGQAFGPVKTLSRLGRAAKVIAHGVAGGAMSMLRGGKFKEGFLSAGISQLAAVTGTYKRLGVSDNPTGTAGYAKNAATSAIIGGTVSKLAGGKFANGAVTAAFSRMFNDLEHGYDDVEYFPVGVGEGPTWDNFVEYNLIYTPWFIGGGIGFGFKGLFVVRGSFPIAKSLGSAASRIPVRGGSHLAEGSRVTNIRSIADRRGIREVGRLVEQYGGKAKNWLKRSGDADVVTMSGNVRRAEVHWYQAHGVGKVEFKVKRWLD